MRLERFSSLPYFHDRKVVQSAILHQKLETDVSLVLPAFSRKFPQYFGRGCKPLAVGSELEEQQKQVGLPSVAQGRVATARCAFSSRN